MDSLQSLGPVGEIAERRRRWLAVGPGNRQQHAARPRRPRHQFERHLDGAGHRSGEIEFEHARPIRCSVRADRPVGQAHHGLGRAAHHRRSPRLGRAHPHAGRQIDGKARHRSVADVIGQKRRQGAGVGPQFPQVGLTEFDASGPRWLSFLIPAQMDLRCSAQLDLQALTARLAHQALAAVLDQCLQGCGSGTDVEEQSALHQPRQHKAQMMDA